MKYIKKRSVEDRRAKEEERKMWRYQEYHNYRALLIRVLHERDCAAVITEIAIQFAPGCNELKFQSTLNKDLIPHLQFVLHPYIPQEVHRPEYEQVRARFAFRRRLRSGIGPAIATLVSLTRPKLGSLIISSSSNSTSFYLFSSSFSLRSFCYFHLLLRTFSVVFRSLSHLTPSLAPLDALVINLLLNIYVSLVYVKSLTKF